MNAMPMSNLTPNNLPPRQSRVLCVDDEPNVLRALQWLLRKDFQVSIEESAQRALAKLRLEDFDVVISDQRMPEMSGADFLGQVKTIAPRAMRILLTGYSDMQAVINSVNEAEVFRFVNKPWDVVELPKIVSQAAEIARTQETMPVQQEASSPTLASECLPKILVLDEDEATHSAVEFSFGDIAEIVHVSSPADAFRILEDEEIGIVLSERKLGTMDLTHLLCLLKRNHPQIVSIVITESEDSNLICRMINQGQIHRFIAKPLKVGNLRLALKSAISKRAELLGNPILVKRHEVPELSEENIISLEKSITVKAERPPTKPLGEEVRPTLIPRLGDLFRRLFSN